jgi:hypothetical protein
MFVLEREVLGNAFIKFATLRVCAASATGVFGLCFCGVQVHLQSARDSSNNLIQIMATAINGTEHR